MTILLTSNWNEIGCLTGDNVKKKSLMYTYNRLEITDCYSLNVNEM